MPSTFQAFAFIAKALKTLSSWYKRAFASFLLDPCERMVCLPTVSICLWLPTKISCTCTNEKATTGSSDDRLPWTRSGISSSDCSRMHPWRRHHLKSCHLPSRRSTCTLLRSAGCIQTDVLMARRQISSVRKTARALPNTWSRSWGDADHCTLFSVPLSNSYFQLMVASLLFKLFVSQTSLFGLIESLNICPGSSWYSAQ